MRNFLLGAILCLSATVLLAQKVTVSQTEQGHTLLVDGDAFMINGMNWDYFPIGTNYTYSLWTQPDDIIKAALDAEMGLLKNMGINAIRMYTGVPSKWIEYIYHNYGIFTMLNHSFGRYGLTLDGAWYPNTEYDDPRVVDQLLNDVKNLATNYQNTQGVLLYLLGNENNYGLFWEGAETEAIPIEDRKSTKRAREMYKLFNQAAVIMKGIDANHPVALCNGDLLFLELIVEECPDVDIFGTNMYRGITFTDAYDRVAKEYDKPFLLTEFGADAFNAREDQEDQYHQAYYDVYNWKDVYANAAGMGRAGNSIGGFTFQWGDGWWKYGQTKNLDIHDNTASWPNGGYRYDFEEGSNNMNEEWFGITAKGPQNALGLYQSYPRAAYYALKQAHQFDPYRPGASQGTLDSFFDDISIMDAVLRARGDKVAATSSDKVRMSTLRAEFTTFNTGGSLISTPADRIAGATQYPDELGFDHMQSYFVGVEGRPANNMRANITVNILGNVAQNPINEIFYENRGRPVEVNSDQGNINLLNLNGVKIYNAEYEWNTKDFDAKGFYRTGHYHWGYEGDFFGLYPEANYGPNLDIYNGEILGMEIHGKKSLEGLKVAFGPQLWWGANPAILAKYTKNLGKWETTAIFHEDIDNLGTAVSTFAVPQPKTRRLTLQTERSFGAWDIQIGGIWAGNPLNGRIFQIADGTPGNYKVYQDEIAGRDNWGGKLKIKYQKGAISWYAQGSRMGLVANGGGDYTRTFTGWRLKDSGSGNQTNFLTGLSIRSGNWEIAPNFLWQKPLVDPMPNDVTGPGRLRNILDDPFSVRINRETIAGELLLTYDPTPGTWMYEWNNDMAEDAKFAASIGFVYRHHPTTMDAHIGFLSDRSIFAFPNSVSAEDLWEVNARLVSKANTDLGWIANLFAGNGQANGSDDRLINRYGGDVRMIYKKSKIMTSIMVNDWGPFDYHRDFNLTYPLQLMLDVSTSLSRPSWFALPSSQLGIRYTWRGLDQYSPRYCPTMTTNAAGALECDPTASGFDNGNEWEIRTYFHINIGK